MTKALKPSFKQVFWRSNSCFNAKIDSGGTLSNAWHYHPELELILVKRSSGTRIVGNSVETFYDNDLVLIGKNTPHAFLHDETFSIAEESPPYALVIQFYEDFMGSDLMRLNELYDIQALLVKARHGLIITESAKREIIPLVESFFEVSLFERMILILQILKLMSQPDAHNILGSDFNHSSVMNVNDRRFNSILDYTYAKFDENIRIDDVAKIVNLTRESFCRFFKMHANKTYIEFLTEYRIKRACQLIRDGEKSIKEIGYACGFDTLSNFYYQFKKITKVSPLEFNRRTSDTGQYL